MNHDHQSPSIDVGSDIQNPIRRAVSIVGNGTLLAKQLGVTAVTISDWASGKRPIPIKRCVEIEVLTNGQVTRQLLRPDDWHEIWPELRDQSKE